MDLEFEESADAGSFLYYKFVFSFPDACQVICIELSNYLTYNEKSYLETLAR